jgi:hypothetical protein
MLQCAHTQHNYKKEKKKKQVEMLQVKVMSEIQNSFLDLNSRLHAEEK